MKNWAEEEIKILKENFVRLTKKELEVLLKRSRRGIEWKLKQLNLKKYDHVSRSEVLTKYYREHKHHMKGVKKSGEHKKKISKARFRYYKRVGGYPSDLRKRISETKIKKGNAIGPKNAMFGKKRYDLSKRNIENWKKEDFRKKIRMGLHESSLEGSRNQKIAHKFFIQKFGSEDIGFNDWSILEYKFEVDILVYSHRVAIEMDGFYWHSGLEIEEKDRRKNQELAARGWFFIRIIDDHMNLYELLNKLEIAYKIIVARNNSEQYKFTAGIYL